MTNLGKVILGIAILVIVASAYFYFRLWTSQPEQTFNPSATSSPSTENTPAPSPSTKTTITPKPATNEITVEMLPNSFIPQTLVITIDTTVKFVNKDKVARWPASGFHPVHDICPGFDAKQSMKPGATYSFTFTVAKQCPYHDHLNPGIRGTIIVNPK
ncbi:MAG: hypothetical protein Q7R91_00920 [bacterium]|nr:hypothetical protein [bacterium]